MNPNDNLVEVISIESGDSTDLPNVDNEVLSSNGINLKEEADDEMEGISDENNLNDADTSASYGEMDATAIDANIVPSTSFDLNDDSSPQPFTQNVKNRRPDVTRNDNSNIKYTIKLGDEEEAKAKANGRTVCFTAFREFELTFSNINFLTNAKLPTLMRQALKRVSTSHFAIEAIFDSETMESLVKMEKPRYSLYDDERFIYYPSLFSEEMVDLKTLLNDDVKLFRENKRVSEAIASISINRLLLPGLNFQRSNHYQDLRFDYLPLVLGAVPKPYAEAAKSIYYIFKEACLKILGTMKNKGDDVDPDQFSVSDPSECSYTKLKYFTALHDGQLETMILIYHILETQDLVGYSDCPPITVDKETLYSLVNRLNLDRDELDGVLLEAQEYGSCENDVILLNWVKKNYTRFLDNSPDDLLFFWENFMKKHNLHHYKCYHTVKKLVELYSDFEKILPAFQRRLDSELVDFRFRKKYFSQLFKAFPEMIQLFELDHLGQLKSAINNLINNFLRKFAFYFVARKYPFAMLQPYHINKFLTKKLKIPKYIKELATYDEWGIEDFLTQEVNYLCLIIFGSFFCIEGNTIKSFSFADSVFYYLCTAVSMEIQNSLVDVATNPNITLHEMVSSVHQYAALVRYDEDQEKGPFVVDIEKLKEEMQEEEREWEEEENRRKRREKRKMEKKEKKRELKWEKKRKLEEERKKIQEKEEERKREEEKKRNLAEEKRLRLEEEKKRELKQEKKIKLEEEKKRNLEEEKARRARERAKRKKRREMNGSME